MAELPRDAKDRGSKWLIEHHGDAILRLAQVSGFSSWRAVQPEVVAPRSLPDGLLEVSFPGQPRPDLFLLEIATYPEERLEQQLERGALLVLLDRGVLPEVIAVVLNPRGGLSVRGESRRISRLGLSESAVRWIVVELWKVPAQRLLDLNEVGVIPYIPLSQFTEPLDEVLGWCQERIERQAPPEQRDNLLAVTWILAGARYPQPELLDRLLRRDAVIESPVLQELTEEIRRRAEEKGLQQGLQEGKRENAQASVLEVLAARFGAVPNELAAQVRAIADEASLHRLLRQAALCADLEAFRTALAAP